MSFLRARTMSGKARYAVKKLLAYFRCYAFYHGWSSYVSMDGGQGALQRIGRLRFCADPFLFHRDGANWLFYETLDDNDKGYLGCYKEVGGRWIQEGCVLEEPWHLSYPQVFEDGGKVYMIPESCDFGKGDVSLYEAVEFPKKWDKVAKLIDRPFADSTILKHDGHWYMACYTIPPKESAELWHAPSLFGPWERHPMWNAINQSNRLRRCGGSFIERDGRLFRVAQDCNGIYGKRLFMVPVLELSATAYREGDAVLLHDKTKPPYGYCHTYNEIVVDGKKLIVVDVQKDTLEWPYKIVASIVKTAWRKLSGRR